MKTDGKHHPRKAADQGSKEVLFAGHVHDSYLALNDLYQSVFMHWQKVLVFLLFLVHVVLQQVLDVVYELLYISRLDGHLVLDVLNLPF